MGTPASSYHYCKEQHFFFLKQTSFLVTLHKDNKNLKKKRLIQILLKSYNSRRRRPLFFWLSFLLSQLFPEAVV